MFYLVTLKRAEYDEGTSYYFEELADAMDFIERAITNAIPGKDGVYPSATLRLEPGATEEPKTDD